MKNFSFRIVVQSLLRRFGYQLVRNTQPQAMVGVSHDPSSSVPEVLIPQLQSDNPRLADLRKRYSILNVPMLAHTWWNEEYIAQTIDLKYFRGDNAYIWQTRHMSGSAELHYYFYARDVLARDRLNLFSKLSEDGAFGCWTFKSRKFPMLSRDLLDSVNELNFLDRHAGIANKRDLCVLDIGAGYGRLAHRSTEALPHLKKYYCVDGVPESTFLSEIYLSHRGCSDQTEVIPIDKLDALDGLNFDIAVNVHSFSEMSLGAVEGWLDTVMRLQIPKLFIVPNDAQAFLTMEADGSRRDFFSSIESRGYKIVASESTIADPDVRELVGVNDYFFLFERSV